MDAEYDASYICRQALEQKGQAIIKLNHRGHENKSTDSKTTKTILQNMGDFCSSFETSVGLLGEILVYKYLRKNNLLCAPDCWKSPNSRYYFTGKRDEDLDDTLVYDFEMRIKMNSSRLC
ncbi:MAG: hypothetical protein M1609_05155 [Firmicutes bacterium]|nr:hypothetical protein [Bacillota bacterium]MCL5057110.1 hypothetical protein [Actinomycetota bacterium]